MSTSDRFAGMTVNERLLEANLLAAFGEARSRWDEEALRSIFNRIDLHGYDLDQLRTKR